jgi:hypothetical protein
VSQLFRSQVHSFEALLICLLWGLLAPRPCAQISSNERGFAQSKAAIDKALKSMQNELAGRLPVLDGFATADHPLERYQRGYYQASVEVSAVPQGSLVRINTKITAWYSDPQPSHSGYQLLSSNGRLEADLLDRLGEQLATTGADPQTAPQRKAEHAEIATVSPNSSTRGQAPDQRDDSKRGEAGNFSSSWNQSLAAQERATARPTPPSAAEKNDSALESEAEGLAEILRNQSHPSNLVAVKKSGTPVVASPSLSAKPLFLASRHDEFEMLDFDQDWVHVRISGLARGWIWRNSLEMPDGIPDTVAHSGPSPSSASDLFHVTRDETGQFPGDWQPLRGKTVRIVSVQQIEDGAKDSGALEKLEFAKYWLEKTYLEVAKTPQPPAGIVLIFDSVDGGMVAATLATLQQWKAGTLSDAALWHNCFFDPPEIFTSAGSSGTQ